MDFTFANLLEAAFAYAQAPYGSEDHEGAQARFFNILENTMTKHDFAKFETWCLKATDEDMIREGIRLFPQGR